MEEGLCIMYKCILYTAKYGSYYKAQTVVKVHIQINLKEISWYCHFRNLSYINLIRKNKKESKLITIILLIEIRTQD